MWVARDKSGELWLFGTKPIRGSVLWDPCDGMFMEIDMELFPNITWNSEPEEVCLCINNEKYHTVRVEELDRLYKIDWAHDNTCEILSDLEDRVSKFNSLPWYKRIFTQI